MTHANHIAKELGQGVIADALGVGLTAVNNAVGRGKFPASWFPIMRALCASSGIDCPESAFTFKSPSCDSPTGILACPQDVAASGDKFKGAAE